VPSNLIGKKVTISASFDLGTLSPDGKALKSKAVQVQL
jgi:hypothetical protein